MDAGNIFSLSLGLCDFYFFKYSGVLNLGHKAVTKVGHGKGGGDSLDIRVGVAWMRVSILRVKAEST